MHFRGGIWLPPHFADGDRRVGRALRSLYRGRRIAEGGRLYSRKGSGWSCFLSPPILSPTRSLTCCALPVPVRHDSRPLLWCSFSHPLFSSVSEREGGRRRSTFGRKRGREGDVDMFVVMYMNLSLDMSLSSSLSLERGHVVVMCTNLSIIIITGYAVDNLLFSHGLPRSS